MNNHTYLTGTSPSSSSNETTTSINLQLPSTTDNNYQFMPQSTDQFTRISPSTSLAKAPTLYQSQQLIGLVGENSSKNMAPAFSVQQHIVTNAHTQHTWDMIQQHYGLGLVDPIVTSSSLSALSSAVKQQNSPTSLGATSANSTPPLYQEMISPSTSSSTSTQAMDSSQQSFRLQHPAHSQMAQVDTSNRTGNASNAQHELVYWEQHHGTLDSLGDTKNNEQQLLHQRKNSLAKPVEQPDQITHQQRRQLEESSLPASGSTLPSSSFLPSDQQIHQNPANLPKQQKLAPASASSNHHKVPDHHIKNDQYNGKRSHQDGSATASNGLGTPIKKKPKTDTNTQQQQQISQQRKASAPAPHFLPSSQPNTLPFTATSFEHMTREQMIERLVLLENERLDLQQQLEQRQVQGGMKHPKNSGSTLAVNNTETASEDNTGKSNSKTGDDDDDDDDEVESISSGADLNPTTDDKTEMKCLWKNCGVIRVGVRDLTDHIVSAHVGGGKPLYRCEWENCRRSHKPFTKRHKICNHLRVHTGERPFVCDKPGCEKRFSRLDSLTTHIKTHSTVRPFICHITGCEKAYYHARSLKKHLKLHEDEKAKENELAGNTLDTSNSNVNPPPVSFTAAASSSGPQPSQQQHHLYPFEEGISLPQFLLQPGPNITASSMRNEQMIDTIIDSAQLFDPLSFPVLTALPMQQQQQQQQQFMQLGESISQVAMSSSTNNNINMMDTLQQQPQKPQQRSNEGPQTDYNVSLPMVSGQPPMPQDGFCL